MGWVQTVQNSEFQCYENKAKTISCRIETRKSEDGWVIYRSYFNKKGLNFTEEFVAPTDDKKNQIVHTLQKTKTPTIEQIQQLILEKSKKISINVERDFKEYSVEKWKFGINGAPSMNFALVRTYDEIDVDVVLHDTYKTYESQILKELCQILGFDGLEDTVNITCYYFTRSGQREISNQKYQTLDLF